MEPRLRGKKQKDAKPVGRNDKVDLNEGSAGNGATKLFLKRTYRVLLLTAIGLSIWSIYTVINRYHISLDWSKNGNSALTMARQTPDSLYNSNAESKAAKQKFNEIYAVSYNIKTDDLTSEATTDEMKKLEQTISHISANSRSDYQTKYDNLLKKVKVNSLYQDVFVGGNYKTVKENVTPETIKKLNDTQFGYINQLLINSSNKDKFAQRIYGLQINLAKDAETINDVMDIAMKTATYDPSSGDVEILKKSTDQQITDYTTAVSQLDYSWDNLAFLNQMEKVIAKDLAEQTEQYRVFDDYKKDLSDKKKADKDLVALKKTLSEALAKQKVDEKRANAYILIPKFTSQSEAQDWSDRNSIRVVFESQWSKASNIVSEPGEGNLLKRTDKLRIIIQRRISSGTSADSVSSQPSKGSTNASANEDEASSSSSSESSSSESDSSLSSEPSVSSSSTDPSSSTSEVSSSSISSTTQN